MLAGATGIDPHALTSKGTGFNVVVPNGGDVMAAGAAAIARIQSLFPASDADRTALADNTITTLARDFVVGNLLLLCSETNPQF